MKRHVLGLNLTFLHSINETYNIRLFLTQSVKYGNHDVAVLSTSFIFCQYSSHPLYPSIPKFPSQTKYDNTNYYECTAVTPVH